MKKILSFVLSVLFLLGCSQISKKTDRTIAQYKPDENSILLTGSVDPVLSGREASSIIYFNTAKVTYKIDVNAITDLSTQQALLQDMAKKEIRTVQIPLNSILSQNTVASGVRPDCSELPLNYRNLKQLAERQYLSASQDIFLDFLRSIPEGSMQSFTLIYSTQSVQKGKEPHHVRPEFPRVLRSNKDGSVSMTYVCDPKSDKYGQVELLYTKGGLIRSAEFDFRSKNQSFEKKIENELTQAKVSEDIPACLECHSTGAKINGQDLLKYNWQEYHVWADCDEKGTRVYGSNDDEMQSGKFRARESSNRKKKNENQCGDDYQKNIGEIEKKNFCMYLPAWKSDPCMGLLPWASNQSKAYDGFNYSYYPYAETKISAGSEGKENYDLRTNLRFNDMYGHQTANQIVKIIKDSPQYPALKFLIAHEALNCSNERTALNNYSNIPSKLAFEDSKKLIKNFNPKFGVFNSQSGLQSQHLSAPDPTTLGPVLFALSISLGLKVDDWSLEFVKKSNGTKNDPIYNLAIVSDKMGSLQDVFDFSLIEIVQGILFKDLVLNESVRGNQIVSLNLKELDDIMSKSVEDHFGKRYSCFDELGAAIKRDIRLGGLLRASSLELKRKACANIEKSHRQLMNQIGRNIENCEECKINKLKAEKTAIENLRASQTRHLIYNSERELEKDITSIIEQGRQFVHSSSSESSCYFCHSDSTTNQSVYSRYINKSKNRFLFLKTNSEFYQDTNWQKLIEQVQSGNMPESNAEITDQQRKAIIYYLRHKSKNQ